MSSAGTPAESSRHAPARACHGRTPGVNENRPELAWDAPGRPEAGLPALRGGGEGASVPRPLDRLERQGQGPQAASHGGRFPASRVSMGVVEEPGVLGPGHGGAAAGGRPGAPPRLAPGALRDVRRRDPVPGVVLPRGQPEARRRDRRGQGKVGEGRLRDAAGSGLPRDPARRAGGRGSEAADAGRAGTFRRLRPPVRPALRDAGRGRHGRRGARAGLPDHPVRAPGAVRGGGRRAAAGGAPGRVDGLRGAREAGRGRVPAAAPGNPRPKPRLSPLEGPQGPRRRRVEDRPAAGTRGERLPRPGRGALPPGHGRALQAARPHPRRLRPVRPRERAAGRPHAPRARRGGRRDRARQGLPVLRHGRRPPRARAGLRLPHPGERQTRCSTPSPPRPRPTGPSPATRPPSGAGRSGAAWSGTSPGTPNAASSPLCRTAGATESSRSATSATAAGASRRCTRAENP